MIPLRLASGFLPLHEQLVLRLRCTNESDEQSAHGRDAYLIGESDGVAEFDVEGFSLGITTDDALQLDRDVILVTPQRTSIQRLIRSSSKNNTLLVTEQCDQLCIMCSQPPKPKHVDLFDIYGQAILLAPRGATIGITGGEPMLHKHKLFEMLLSAKDARPDLSFHVLTNGQHFESTDMRNIEELGPDRVMWGIPLYSSEAQIHDKIVLKPGAFARLKESFSLLAGIGARVELRTVVLNSNVWKMEKLGFFISRHLPFIDFWAIMQLENIGFGRMNWVREFYDNSISFSPLSAGIDVASAFGTQVRLYNFPMCTVPTSYQHLAVSSISDWKNRFLPVCDGCAIQNRCAGFFEWHPKTGGFERLQKQ